SLWFAGRHGDLGAEAGAVAQLEPVAAPEAPGVEPVGRAAGIEQAHAGVGDREQLGAVDGLLGGLALEAPGEPLARELAGLRERPALVLGDDPQAGVLHLAGDLGI